MTLDEAIAIAKNVYEDESASAQGRKDYKQIAEWLEELKQYKEEKQETNLDHFQQEILEKGLWNLAVVKGGPKRCDRTKCIDCELSKDRSRGCHEKVMDWLEQPYKAPANKLTKFEKCLLQSFLCTYEFKDVRPLTGMKEEGYFKGIDENATLEDILADCEITEED